MTMANIPPSPAPRGRRIPLSQFWLDWRISLFLVAVCTLVLGAGLLALWGWRAAPPPVTHASPAVHRERGEVYERLGKLEEAIGEYRVALRLSPADPTLHRALAGLFEKQGRIADAIATYERALELDPASPEAPDIRVRLEQLRQAR